MKWIRWYSLRDNDGRRTSGVRYNKSKWHAMRADVASVAICGAKAEEGFFATATTKYPQEQDRICKSCLRYLASRTLHPIKEP